MDKAAFSKIISIASVCGALAAIAASDSPSTKWRNDLYLGRGGFWKCRAPITATNHAPETCNGRPVSLKVGKDLPIAGVRLEELRLVDEKGKELLFGAWGDKRIENGPLPEGVELSIPVSLPAKGTAVYWLYWNNPSAWGYADFFKERVGFEKSGVKLPAVSARVGATELLSAAFVGEDAAWPVSLADSSWTFRVPVRLANFSAIPMAASLSSFSIREAVRGTRDADFRLMDGATEISLCALNDRVFFSASVPAQTVKTLWLYVRRGSPNAGQKPEEALSALGSAIPSDQVLVRKTTISDEAAFANILKSSANLVKNPCFADGSAGWTHSKEAKDTRVAYETSATGGKFGGGFAKTTIPAGEKAIWRGWYQNISIKPDCNYLYGGFISSEDADTHTAIYLHKHDAKGRNTMMAHTLGGVAGTAPWTPAFGTFHAGNNDATATLHLTTCGHGKFAYDGIVVAEYAHAQVGDPQPRPASRQATLAVQSVDPVVKVFRESPVSDSHSFEVCLAKNETEPLQLAVRATQTIGRLSVEATPPVMPDGTGGISVETGWVEYVPVDYPTAYYSSRTPEWMLKHPTSSPGSDGWSGWWPDPIAPVNAGPVAANTTQPVWINVKSSTNTKAGTYTGKIKWRADGKVVREDAFTVRVWNFALPAVAETPAIYDLRLLDSKWWKHDFNGLDADGRRRLLWKFNSEKRICPDSIGEQPTFSRAPDGTVKADFKEYDRLAAEYFGEFKFPVSYTPGIFYCFGWAMPPRKFLGEDPYPGKWPYDGADRMKLRPEYKKAYQDALRLYWNHMKAKGWADKLVLYISDEPHFAKQTIKAQMIACCRMIHEVDPSIRIYSSTWRHCPAWNDSIDVWGVGHYGNFPVGEMKARTAAGKHIWFTTDGQMCLDTPYCAVERLLPHYCAAFHAEAYEFWGSTWFTYDPWKYGWHSYIPQTDKPGWHYFVRYPDGDGYLFYPGVPGRFKGPVTSIRLEAVRDGVEDFSYLKRLERLADGSDTRAERAKALLAEFRALVTIPNAGGRYSPRILPEPEKIGILRRKAGDLLGSL